MNLRRYTVVDVFTDVPLAGNALAVFLDASGLDPALMQRAARELNLSETAFILPCGDPRLADAEVRIFTPAAELPFAGHPVLGSAIVLGERTGASRLRLLTGVGAITVALRRERETIVYAEMEHGVPEPEPFPAADELLRALGVKRAQLPVEAYRNGPLHVYVALSGEDQVSALSPDLGALAGLSPPVGVSCFAGSGTRFRSRMFAPGLGVIEDPATGSAAGPLVVHLVRHGVVSAGETIEIRQGEEIGRPSLLRACLEGNRVLVGGGGVIVAQGEYRLQ